MQRVELQGGEKGKRCVVCQDCRKRPSSLPLKLCPVPALKVPQTRCCGSYRHWRVLRAMSSRYGARSRRCAVLSRPASVAKHYFALHFDVKGSKEQPDASYQGSVLQSTSAFVPSFLQKPEDERPGIERGFAGRDDVWPTRWKSIDHFTGKTTKIDIQESVAL